MPPEPLTEADVEAAFRALVPEWFLERMDTQLGTADTVRALKSSMQMMGSVSSCEDGPYPEFSRWIERHARGAHVRVFEGDPDRTPLREGFVAWNLLANRATLTALRLRRDAQPRVGAQMPLFA